MPNPEEVLLWENPSMLDNPWYGNPRRRRRRKNPAKALSMGGLKDFTQGVGAEEILGGGLGLVAAAAAPRMIIAPEKSETGVDLTMNEKLMRVGIGVITTFGIGFLAQNIVSKGAAKAAVIGGLAGVAVTAVNTLTPMRLGSSSGVLRGKTARGRVSLNPPVGADRGIRTQTPGFENLKLY